MRLPSVQLATVQQLNIYGLSCTLAQCTCADSPTYNVVTLSLHEDLLQRILSV